MRLACDHGATMVRPWCDRGAAVVRRLQVSKGAPHALLDMAHNRDAIRGAVEAQVEQLAARGIRSLGVACTNNDAGGRAMQPRSAATVCF